MNKSRTSSYQSRCRNRWRNAQVAQDAPSVTAKRKACKHTSKRSVGILELGQGYVCEGFYCNDCNAWLPSEAYKPEPLSTRQDRQELPQ